MTGQLAKPLAPPIRTLNGSMTPAIDVTIIRASEIMRPVTPNQSGNATDGLSRRSFVCGSMLTSAGAAMIDAASAIVGTAGAKEANAVATNAPDPVPIVLRVNGMDRMLQVEPRMTLAETLRGPHGLTGTKIACDRGACSACTVWLDDDPPMTHRRKIYRNHR